MNPIRIELAEWGCVVSLVDGHLYSAPAPLTDETEAHMLPVDLVCRHFLADVNAALGSDFVTDEFDLVSCEGCQRADDHLEPQHASTP